jgi:hypothetical protein
MSRRRPFSVLLALVAVSLGGAPLAAASVPLQERLTPELRARVLEATAVALEEQYVFPEKGAAMARTLRRNLAEGRYDGIADAAVLAKRLEGELRELGDDEHLGVVVDPRRGEGTAEGAVAPAPVLDNFGFRKAEFLEGGIACLRIDRLDGADAARPVAAAAMNFVAGAEALILDLRENRGGSPSMDALLSGYLYDEPVVLHRLFDRITGETREIRSNPIVFGRRFGGTKPLFVLTSARTFSAAEGLAYQLKHHGRAVVVGERTRGGAHPKREVPLPGSLVLHVPYARAIHPVTGSNWQGVGVEPDVAVPAGEALDRALRLARDAIEKVGKK